MLRADLCADTVHTKPDEKKGLWAQGPHKGKGWTPKKQRADLLGWSLKGRGEKKK